MLCQLSDIKTRLAISGSGEDTVLTAFANATETRFNQYCRRVFARASGTSTEFDAEAMQVSLDHYPVETITGIYLRRTYSDAWEDVDVDYDVLVGGIVALASVIGVTGQRGKVVYSGGYVLPGSSPGAGQTALPADIQFAAIDQTCLWYEQRHALRTMQVGAKGAISPATSALQIAPHVAEILDTYRRLQA